MKLFALYQLTLTRNNYRAPSFELVDLNCQARSADEKLIRMRTLYQNIYCNFYNAIWFSDVISTILAHICSRFEYNFNRFSTSVRF